MCVLMMDLLTLRIIFLVTGFWVALVDLKSRGQLLMVCALLHTFFLSLRGCGPC